MPFDESAYKRIACNSDTPIIRMSSGQEKDIIITLYDEAGNAVDIDSYIPEGAESSSSSSGTGLVVKLVAGQWHDCDVDFTIEGTVIDASAGQVQFHFSPSHTNKPGIFVASVGITYDDVLQYQMMHYLEFMPNNFNISSVGGPITVPEVRMYMMDMCPVANYLLDELEFTDAEVISAMRMAVDLYNEANPPVGGYTYDSFPYRANWIKGSAAILLRMVANRYRRNTLRYSAGGITVADQERTDSYMRDAERYMEEYKQWVTDKKVAINLSLGYGRIGPSPYGLQ